MSTRKADGEQDARGVLSYLVAPEAAHYIAIMDVLEASITDLTPDEVAAALASAQRPIEVGVVQLRLDQLREWGAVSARSDTARILRYEDLLARNWRYTPTTVGRQVQRFYRKVLAGTPAVREIPLASLARVVQAVETLSVAPQVEDVASEQIGRLFVDHDDLDSALVGAEDGLTGLIDRFDLDDDATAELKLMLVDYATHVAAELDRGAERAFAALSRLRPRFPDLVRETVRASDARQLIERGALSASHGGRTEDWEALLAWFDPFSGRAQRFTLRLVRALPGMHANLRRLHSSSGAVTSRARALALAKACLHPEHGAAILLAALGDHSWRKLYGDGDEAEGPRIRSWREPPYIELPELLRTTGRTGVRGRAPAARDDSSTRDQVARARERRAAEHDLAIREVLSTPLGAQMSERAARVALASLLAAVRASCIERRRTAVRDGLACTLFEGTTEAGGLWAPTWHVSTPHRIPVFHSPGTVAQLPPQVVRSNLRTGTA